jgi:hypothetical protein
MFEKLSVGFRQAGHLATTEASIIGQCHVPARATEIRVKFIEDRARYQRRLFAICDHKSIIFPTDHFAVTFSPGSPEHNSEKL